MIEALPAIDQAAIDQLIIALTHAIKSYQERRGRNPRTNLEIVSALAEIAGWTRNATPRDRQPTVDAILAKHLQVTITPQD